MRPTTLERIRTNGSTADTTAAPNPLLINPDLASQLSLYSADEIRATIVLMQPDRASRSAPAADDAAGPIPDGSGDLVERAVDPKEEARLHDVDPGFWRAMTAI